MAVEDKKGQTMVWRPEVVKTKKNNLVESKSLDGLFAKMEKG